MKVGVTSGLGWPSTWGVLVHVGLFTSNHHVEEGQHEGAEADMVQPNRLRE